MTNFIEEFYYGNIDPQARSFEQNKKVQRDMQMLNESEDFLTDKLSASVHSLRSIPSLHQKHPTRTI